MFFFHLFGNLAVVFALLFSIGLILIACAIYYSVRNYGKPVDETGIVDEHSDPGIPLVLKALYLGIGIYIIVVTLYVALRGIAI